MKKLLSISILVLSQIIWSQTETNFPAIEYTDLKKALLDPSKVVRLNLSNQEIDFQNQDFSVFKNLEYLNLTNDHLKTLPSSINKLSNLKVLDLSGNDFSEINLDFKNFKNLQELYLNNEKNLNLPKTLKQLAKLPNLKSLHLEHDNLQNIPSEIQLLKNLERLYLNENNFKEIPKEIKGLPHLQQLDLKKNVTPLNMNPPENLNFGFKINL